MRILLVDDLWARRNALCRQLKSWGMRPDIQEQTVETMVAIREAALNGDPYKAVLLECDLRDRIASNFCKSIKNDPEFWSIPLIAIVPSFDRLKDKDLANADFSQYIFRPMRQLQLAEALVSIPNAQKSDKSIEAFPHSYLESHRNSGDLVSQEEKNEKPIKARILVVEDNPVNQLVAQKMLESIGCRVDIVSNGMKAFEKFESVPYDLIFMDCQMPEMDGYESTRKIRQAEKRTDGHIPIIAMTAHVVGNARDKCIQAGMDDFISKPINEEELHGLVSRWCLREKPNFKRRIEEEIYPNCGNGQALEKACIDIDVVIQLKSMQQEGDPDIYDELFSVFSRDMLSRFSTLRNSLIENDTDTFEKTAHRLKGSASQLGIVRMANICKSLEEKGRAKSLDGVEVMLDDLEKEYLLVEKLVAEKPWEAVNKIRGKSAG